MNVAIAATALGVASLCGCSRPWWRQQADDLTYEIIRQNESLDPRWELPRIDVAPDPRSRFFDPWDPDCEPLPPDDPAANQYMHWVYGMRGWRGWSSLGETASVENPTWLQPFGFDSSVVDANYSRPGTLPQIRKLTLEEAIELSYIHSRDYQQQIENLYLSSLNLTAERFRFDVQFVGLGNRRPSSDLFFTAAPNNVNQLGWTPRAGVSQFLPTGGQWLVELANNTIWLFAAGGSSSSTSSAISFQILQPLLANGGRKFALESLTQTERNVLYQLRQLVRYRQGFFVQTVAGSGFSNVSGTANTGTNLVTAAATTGIGTALSGAGVGTGTTGTAGAGTAVGTTAGTTAGAVAGGGGGGVAVQGGFLGLLQQSQVIANQDYNIFELRQQLDRLRARASQRANEHSENLPELPPGIVIPDKFTDRLTVRQLRPDNPEVQLILRGAISEEEQQELVALSDNELWKSTITELWLRSTAAATTLSVAQLESQLANSRSAQINNRRQLQDLLDNYKIALGLPTDLVVDIDRELVDQFQFIDRNVVDLRLALTNFVDVWSTIDAENVDLQQEQVRAVAVGLTVLRDRLYKEGLQQAEADLARAQEYLPKRLSTITDPAEVQRITRNQDGDKRLLVSLRSDMRRIDALLAAVLKTLETDNLPVGTLRELSTEIAELREAMIKVAQTINVSQINSRSELLTLNPFDMSMTEAVEIALRERQDLMNARGQVMDARRRVEVAAVQLQTVLTLVASGDIRTPPIGSNNVNPFDFRSDLSTVRVGVAVTAPIQLVSERNSYRATLIGYQQSRRNYMLAEDQVKQSVRVAWRQLDALRQNFEIGRQGLRFAAVQLDQAIEQSTAPVVGAAGAGGNQGLNLLQALNSVLTAQNNLIQIWINYETNRLNIHRDMGIMQVDESGFWVDDFYQNRAAVWRAGGGVYNQPTSEFLPDSLSTPSQDNAIPVARPMTATGNSDLIRSGGPEEFGRSKLGLVPASASSPEDEIPELPNVEYADEPPVTDASTE